MLARVETMSDHLVEFHSVANKSLMHAQEKQEKSLTSERKGRGEGGRGGKLKQPGRCGLCLLRGHMNVEQGKQMKAPMNERAQRGWRWTKEADQNGKVLGGE